MIQRVLGIDHSLTNTACFLSVLEGGKLVDWSYQSITTKSKDPIGNRLWATTEMVASFLSDEPDLSVVGIEGLSRGSPFRREEMGMSYACSILGVKLSNHSVLVHDVSPRTHKAFICPDWPGLNKKNWEAAGNTKKFKGSLPDKVSVMSAISRRWGVTVDNDHESDAASVSLWLAHEEGWLK